MTFKSNVKIILFLLIVSLVMPGCAKNSGEGDKAQTAVNSSVNEQKDSVKKTRKVVDMYGREIEIPAVIKKAYATSQIGIIVLYSLNPDKLAGWGFSLSDDDKKFIGEKYYSLPVLGVWSGKTGSGNIEEIIKVHPDVIFSITTKDDSQKDLADKVQKQTGIPVIMVDSSLEKLDSMYETIGGIMDEKTRAKELGDYCAKTVSDIKAIKEKIPEDKRVKVYYAEGPKGLETDPEGSFHTEVLSLVGGVNVAKVQMQGGFGRSSVSMEQLLSWNPDVIIVGYDKDAKAGFFNDIYKDSNWKSIKAIKEKKVYSIPNRPFDWFDRPPSVNRIIGVKWLSNLLYPEYVKLNIEDEVKNFYEKFYHKELSSQEVKELLANN